jgi:hypothetical protein
VVATTAWFHTTQSVLRACIAGDSGAAVRADNASQKGKNASVNLLGVVTDEQGRSVGGFETRSSCSRTADRPGGKQLQYQSGVTLPAGHFRVKVAVRENAERHGDFRVSITIPDLKGDALN